MKVINGTILTDDVCTYMIISFAYKHIFAAKQLFLSDGICNVMRAVSALCW